MLKSITILTFIFAALLGCGEANEITPEQGLIPNHEILNGANLEASEDKLTGTGSVLFEKPLLEGVDGSHSFYLESKIEDGGSVSLVVFANESLASGVTISLSRSGEALSLTVDIGGTSRSYTDLPEELVADDTNLLLFTVIQGEPTRVLAWRPSSTAKYNSSDAIFDTSVAEDDPGWTNQKGQSDNWGISLTQATVTYARNFANERLN